MRGLEVFTVNVTSFSSHVCIQFEEQAEVREVWNRPFKTIFLHSEMLIT